MSTILPSRRNPFQSLRDEMENAFERWLPLRHGEKQEFFSPSLWAIGAPTVDMEEDEEEVRIKAEMPGVEKDDFKIEIDRERVCIKGEKKTIKEGKRKDYLYSECSYGSFERFLQLPCAVNASKAQAQLKNGVLEVKLPKAEPSKKQAIQVKVM